MSRVCHISKEILFAAFEEVYNSSHLTEGVMVKRFEEEASKLHKGHAVSTSNAGTALFTIMSLMKKKTGRVLVSNNTFFATGAMAEAAGWQVILADCSADFCLSLETITQMYVQFPFDAVILTHVGGALATQYVAIAAFCKKNGIKLVEDAAHAYGVKGEGGYMAGELSHAAVFSFYPTKAVPVGEGGLVITQDKLLAEEVATFRNYGKYMSEGKVQYTGVGFNFRMDEWTAAVAWLQTKRIDEIICARAGIASRLAELVPEHPAFKGRNTNYYKYIAEPDADIVRTAGKVYDVSDQLANSMKRKGRFIMSEKVSAGHICIPLQEGLYDGMHLGKINDYLKGR